MPGVSDDKHRAQRRCPEPDLLANMLPINTSRARVSVGTTLALPPAKEMVGMRMERTMSEGWEPSGPNRSGAVNQLTTQQDWETS